MLGNLSSVPTTIPQPESHQCKPEAVLMFQCQMRIHSIDMSCRFGPGCLVVPGNPSSRKEFHGAILFRWIMRREPTISLLLALLGTHPCSPLFFHLPLIFCYLVLFYETREPFLIGVSFFSPEQGRV